MAKAEKQALIRGDDGRLYKRGASGITEVFDPVGHAKRQLDAIGETFTITGLRLSDPADPDAPGVVVTLAPDEAAVVVDAVKRVLKARAKG